MMRGSEARARAGRGFHRVLGPVAAGLAGLVLLVTPRTGLATVPTPVPPEQRSRVDAERSGTHDASNIRTAFWNYGMVGDYPIDPLNVDLSVFHSVEVPKGSGMNYSDGITPFVLARIVQADGVPAYIMETGYRERQGMSPFYNRMMRFEPRPGYFEPSPGQNPGRSPAISNDPRTWPAAWPDRLDDPDDPGWSASWNGYFGKQIVADQESYTVMDDQFYDAWNFYPDSRDSTRKGLGLRVEVRGFQWANPQARNVIFWHYDITNEGTTVFDKNIVFGLYMDSGVGGSQESCDRIAESDDDNAFFDRTFDEDVLNLVYTWDRFNHGIDLSGNCGRTGYLGYAYLETPGNPFDRLDNDEDGVIDERRDSGSGARIAGRDEIRAYFAAHPDTFDLARFEIAYGPLENRPAYRAGVWWTGDEDMDWTADLHDLGADGLPGSHDSGEADGIPTLGEPNFDRTDLNESDQIGLTGFKFNRIKPGKNNPDPVTDNVLFYTDTQNWPQRLFEQFTAANPADRFDRPLANNYNIAFLFASGPFTLLPGKTERFSLALAYGADINELRRTVQTVQQIYNANYRFAVPPPLPTVTAESGDHSVRLSWTSNSEKAADPVTGEYDFEGYRIYRSTDPEFRDPKVITTGTGSGPIGNGRPMAQFDLDNAINSFSDITVEGVAYYLGDDTGLTHTWTDTSVVNGQEYYYAVCAYDHGSESFGFYPSENSITVSRTPRGGTILPINVVRVRPNARAAGFVGATADTAQHTAGRGDGLAEFRIVNSGLIPDGHLVALQFVTPAPESLRALSYTLIDSTDHRVLFRGGTDFDGLGTGPVGQGILPVVTGLPQVAIDETRTGLLAGGPTNLDLVIEREFSLPVNLIRPGYPDDISLIFDDVVRDTSLAFFTLPARPAKFIVVAHARTGDRQLDFRFKDDDGNGTLSGRDEYIEIVTYAAAAPTLPKGTWLVKLNPAVALPPGTPPVPPALGDRFELVLKRPFSSDDLFMGLVHGERVDEALAKQESAGGPYVVPNPYVASASFEPERFAVSGRGERRLEFRGLPARCTIRIYTVHGDLVQTLYHGGEGSGPISLLDPAGAANGYEPWNLRTKDNLDVAPGLYIFHVDSGRLGTRIGKFAIIK